MIRLAELAKQESEAIATHNDALILALDQDIENTLGVKERALGAPQGSRLLIPDGRQH